MSRKKAKQSKNPNRGTDFTAFLEEEGIREEVEARALKQSISLIIQKTLKAQNMTKQAMAARMKTSRASIDRLLDQNNCSVTLKTLNKAANALGKKIKIQLVPA